MDDGNDKTRVLTYTSNPNRQSEQSHLYWYIKIKKTIGRVTEEEKNEIQALFERRNGLNELSQILTVENEALYEKLMKEEKKSVILILLKWKTNYNKENGQKNLYQDDSKVVAFVLLTCNGKKHFRKGIACNNVQWQLWIFLSIKLC